MKSASKLEQKIRINYLDNYENLKPLTYASHGASGLDMRAAIGSDKKLELKSMDRMLIQTGVSIELPQYYEAQIRSRSGLALNHGIFCLNSPGTIDSDYKGEIKILLMNIGKESFFISHGMRIAQLVIAPVMIIQQIKNDQNMQKRDCKGFGSTGIE